MVRRIVILFFLYFIVFRIWAQTDSISYWIQKNDTSIELLREKIIGRETIRMDSILVRINSEHFSFDKEDIYLKYDKEPSYPGGIKELKKYIKQNLIDTSYESIQRVVIVTFVIKANGQISNIGIGKGINVEYDLKAIHSLKGMPSWHPAVFENKPINCLFHIPVIFSGG